MMVAILKFWVQKISRKEEVKGYYISPNFFPYMNAYDNLKYMLKLKNIKDDAEIDRV